MCKQDLESSRPTAVSFFVLASRMSDYDLGGGPNSPNSRVRAMPLRMLIAVASISLVALAAWLNMAAPMQPASRWTEVTPGILRSPGVPAGHALIADGKALLIDAPCPAEGLGAAVEQVLLTHYHRASVAAVDFYLKNNLTEIGRAHV